MNWLKESTCSERQDVSLVKMAPKPQAVVCSCDPKRENERKKGIASDTIPSHRTVLLIDLIAAMDGYSFANVHVKGIVAFKHLKKL